MRNQTVQNLRGILKSRQQGVGAGSAYVVVSLGISGVMTYGFQSLSTHVLGKQGYAPLALLWSATFLTVQVLWIAGTQTLGRYVSERETKGHGWQPVVASVKRWQAGLLVVFVLAAFALSPLLTNAVFQGNFWLTVAFIAAVAAYAPEYFRRGIFNGHRQFSRLGGQLVAEQTGRLIIAAILLLVGIGVAGPAIAIIVAPLIGVLAVRPAPVGEPKHPGEPFSAVKAARFAGPVLACMACAQIFANGGPLLVSILGGTRSQVSVFTASLILTRVPQYVLSPAVESLLPHASRILATGGRRAFDRFVIRALGLITLVGVVMVAGTWPLGEWAVRLFAGPGFNASREVLVMLAALAAFYLICDMLNQALFARNLTRFAAVAWVLGLPVSAVCLALLQTSISYRISESLLAGMIAVAVFQAAFYLLVRGRPDSVRPNP